MTHHPKRLVFRKATYKLVKALPTYDLPALLAKIKAEMAETTYSYEEDLIGDATLLLAEELVLAMDESDWEGASSRAGLPREVAEFNSSIRSALLAMLNIAPTTQWQAEATKAFEHHLEDALITAGQERSRWKQEERERDKDRGEYIYDRQRERRREDW